MWPMPFKAPLGARLFAQSRLQEGSRRGGRGSEEVSRLQVFLKRQKGPVSHAEVSSGSDCCTLQGKNTMASRSRMTPLEPNKE